MKFGALVMIQIWIWIVDQDTFSNMDFYESGVRTESRMVKY